MASEEFKREYGQHLVDQVLKGQMTRRQLLVRASVFGFSLTAAGSCSRPAAAAASEPRPRRPPAAAARPTPVMGGSLTGVIPPSITDMDPVTIYDQGGIVLIQQVCEYLIALDNKNGLKPSLAESWSGNADASVWTFKLRQGVTFNDGSPDGGRRRGRQHGARRRSQERLRRPRRARRASSRPAAPRPSTPPRSSSPSTSRSPTSRTWSASRRTTRSSCRAPTPATS